MTRFGMFKWSAWIKVLFKNVEPWMLNLEINSVHYGNSLTTRWQGLLIPGQIVATNMPIGHPLGPLIQCRFRNYSNLPRSKMNTFPECPLKGTISKVDFMSQPSIFRGYYLYSVGVVICISIEKDLREDKVFWLKLPNCLQELCLHMMGRHHADWF